MDKSSRHSEILGDFGEYFICNWLSRSGFEVSIVDHTGIDLVAFNRKTKERLGITVKSRAREKEKKNEKLSITILKSFKGEKSVKYSDDLKKLLNACIAFGCEPYIAVYVEKDNEADAYMTSLDHSFKRYCSNKNKTHEWYVSNIRKKSYEKDLKIKHIHVTFNTEKWVW